MTPFKILKYLLSIFLTLAFVMLIFPSEGIKLSDNTYVYFYNFNDFFSTTEVKYKDISYIVESVGGEDKNEDNESHEHTEVQPLDVKEIVKPDKVKPKYKPKDFGPKDQSFEYPENNVEMLYPLFTALTNKNDTLRILHFGDSQLELDRITSVIRNRFQKKFGGSGMGLIPLNTPYAKYPEIRFKASDNFEKKVIQQFKKDKLNHRRYGVLNRFSKFKGDKKNDTIKSWFRITNVDESNYSLNNITNCRLLYGNSSSPVNFSITCNSKNISNSILEESSSLKEVNWEIPSNTDTLQIEFSGVDSPEFYGLSLESGPGVYVDNIPARSSSGIIFTINDFKLLRESFNRLNVKLVILQFGANKVKNLSSSYSHYERALIRQIQTLRKIDPELAIIVIGVSDMSRHVKGKYETYPSVEKIRDAQRNAALKTGCVFWDLYKAMGGKESMPAWVFHKPPLASKRDFAHFTYSGSRVVGKLFNKAFFHDYNKYQEVMRKSLEQRRNNSPVKPIQ